MYTIMIPSAGWSDLHPQIAELTINTLTTIFTNLTEIDHFITTNSLKDLRPYITLNGVTLNECATHLLQICESRHRLKDLFGALQKEKKDNKHSQLSRLLDDDRVRPYLTTSPEANRATADGVANRAAADGVLSPDLMLCRYGKVGLQIDDIVDADKHLASELYGTTFLPRWWLPPARNASEAMSHLKELGRLTVKCQHWLVVVDRYLPAKEGMVPKNWQRAMDAKDASNSERTQFRKFGNALLRLDARSAGHMIFLTNYSWLSPLEPWQPRSSAPVFRALWLTEEQEPVGRSLRTPEDSTASVTVQESPESSLRFSKANLPFESRSSLLRFGPEENEAPFGVHYHHALRLVRQNKDRVSLHDKRSKTPEDNMDLPFDYWAPWKLGFKPDFKSMIADSKSLYERAKARLHRLGQTIRTQEQMDPRLFITIFDDDCFEVTDNNRSQTTHLEEPITSFYYDLLHPSEPETGDRTR